MRRVVVEVQPDREHPLPQLGRVREVAGIAVGMPALHHAVLDDHLDAGLARVIDERPEHVLGVAQVVGDRSAGIAADERADRRATEQHGRVDAAQHVFVDRAPLVGDRDGGCCRSNAIDEHSSSCFSSSCRVASASPGPNSSARRCVAVNGRSPSAGHAAISSASKSCACAHSQICASGRRGRQAVRNPSFIAAPRSRSTGLGRPRHPPTGAPTPSAEPRR